MGAPGPNEGGIIPRLCDALFERIAVQQSPPALTYKVIIKQGRPSDIFTNVSY